MLYLIVQYAICVASLFYHCSPQFCVVLLLLDHIVNVIENWFLTDLPVKVKYLLYTLIIMKSRCLFKKTEVLMV